jgi:hypothetical protein
MPSEKNIGNVANKSGHTAFLWPGRQRGGVCGLLRREHSAHHQAHEAQGRGGGVLRQEVGQGADDETGKAGRKFSLLVDTGFEKSRRRLFYIFLQLYKFII